MSKRSEKMQIDDAKASTLTRLNAQKIEALQRNDTKTAALINKIILLLTENKKK